MKWIALALIALGVLLFIDQRNGTLPLAIGAGIFLRWYFLDREEPEPAEEDSAEPTGTGEPLIESSANFDVSDFGPFLQRIQRHIPKGFEQRIIDHISGLATRMRHNEERLLEYVVSFDGQLCPLKILLFKDDAEEITASFHAPERLAGWIDSEIESFSTAQGR